MDGVLEKMFIQKIVTCWDQEEIGTKCVHV